MVVASNGLADTCQVFFAHLELIESSSDTEFLARIKEYVFESLDLDLSYPTAAQNAEIASQQEKFLYESVAQRVNQSAQVRNQIFEELFSYFQKSYPPGSSPDYWAKAKTTITDAKSFFEAYPIRAAGPLASDSKQAVEEILKNLGLWYSLRKNIIAGIFRDKAEFIDEYRERLFYYILLKTLANHELGELAKDPGYQGQRAIQIPKLSI